MNFTTQQACQESVSQFNKQRYAKKLKWFDQHFELIPFDFPPFDPIVGWYKDFEQFNLLSEIFTCEKRASNSFLVQQIMVEEKEFIFSIVPRKGKSRILLNEYVVRKFLSEESSIQKKFLQKLRKSKDDSRLIKERIFLMAEVLGWIPEAIRSNADLLQLQFLNVFHNGIRSVELNRNTPVSSKRKFIELYLFSQGMLFMQHYNWLITLYEKSIMVENTELLSLSQKILLLHELGVIDYLKQRLKEENIDKKIREISRIISLVTAENAIYYSTVLQHVNTLLGGDAGEHFNDHGHAW